KRKKKTYTKPKKIKHKHKKVKLSVLQFYKVDDSGKVQRLRKECPNAECGAGTFMANHFDRHYCELRSIEDNTIESVCYHQSNFKASICVYVLWIIVMFLICELLSGIEII
ncbi:hypothetical protein R6Q57_014980, partial [Mikania cordata]